MNLIGNMNGDQSKPIRPTILTQSMKDHTVNWAQSEAEDGKGEITFLASEIRKIYDDYQRLKTDNHMPKYDLDPISDQKINALLDSGESVLALTPKVLIDLILAHDAYDMYQTPGFWRT